LDWQAYLWVNAMQITHQSLPDKTQISAYILEHIQQPNHQQKLQKALPCLYLFGLSVLTQYHIHLLYSISQVIPVKFYLQNPAPEIFWMDDKNNKDLAVWRHKGYDTTYNEGNDLLTSWGKILQSTFRMLFKYEEVINNYEVLIPEEPSTTTLLQKIQNDIFNNATHDYNEITLADLKDGSVSIHAHYTPLREVQSLYNYIVHLFDKRNEQLSPRDIIVMVNDINAYAPYINAIFNNAETAVPFRIADLSIMQGDSLYNALEKILQLNEQSFTAEAVLDLLESSWIRNRFNINPINNIRQLVNQANIRFGIAGDDADETRLVSWEYGIKRIMYGICMSGSELFTLEQESLYPLDVIEGQDTANVTAFCHFVLALIQHLKSRKQDRNIVQWSQFMEYTVHELLYFPQDQVEDSYTVLIEHLKLYNEVQEWVKEQIPYHIFATNIILHLTEQNTNAQFLSNGVTFCSMLPMRSIPFKVVAVLGLDAQKFPRKETLLHFNLIHQKPRLGDRNVKENDKHLFLETLLSAKKYLYLSYIGKSISDNTTLNPSIALEELLSYIQNHCNEVTLVEQILVTQHPLYLHSKKYNASDESLYNYFSMKSDAQQNTLLLENNNEQITSPDTIAYKDITAFYKNGVKHYFNKILKVYYNDATLLIPETELFEMDNLQLWQLNQALLGLNDIDDVENFIFKQKRLGNLPLKNIGNLTVTEQFEKLKDVQDLLLAESKGINPETIPYEIVINNICITGTLNNVYANKYIHIAFSKNIFKNALTAYLEILIGIATGHIQHACIITATETPQCITAQLQGMNATIAQSRLAALLSIYQQGLQKIIPINDYLLKTLLVQEDIDDHLIQTVMNKVMHDTFNVVDDPYLHKATDWGVFDKTGISIPLVHIQNVLQQPLNQMFNLSTL
jgi:exodeoxyribonuclease V gamma subunit